MHDIIYRESQNQAVIQMFEGDNLFNKLGSI